MIGPGAQGLQAPALDMRGVVRQFGSVRALHGVDLEVARGTVHALLGENGAGKTTLVRIAYGIERADAGDLRLFGRPTPGHSVRGAIAAGVGMVHQHLSLVPQLTAAENIALGDHGWFRPRDASRRLRHVAQSSGLDVPADVVVGNLSIVEQQRLEILKALARNARLLILDEPTAVLAPGEVGDLLAWIRRFAGGGGTVVMVTHKLREALAVADHVTVLRRGAVAFTGKARDTSEAALARAMFPDASDADDRRAEETSMRSPGEAVVVAEHAVLADPRGVERLHDASFRVHRHEITAIAAIEGSGHRELLLALAGLTPVSGGALRVPDRRAVIPADRQAHALVGEFTLTENVALRGLGARRGLMPWRLLAARTGELIRRYDIAAPGPSARAATLSGGNQQRLVIARELWDDVDLVVADNPTRGLDARAAAFVHEQLRRAAMRGAAVVVHSSDVDELLALATRVLVVHAGTLRESPLDRASIGRAMLGAA